MITLSASATRENLEGLKYNPGMLSHQVREELQGK